LGGLGFSTLDFGIEIVFFPTGCSLVFIDYFGIYVFKTARCVNKKNRRKKEKQLCKGDKMKEGKQKHLVHIITVISPAFYYQSRFASSECFCISALHFVWCLFGLAAMRRMAPRMQRRVGRAPAGASTCTPCTPGSFSASTGPVPCHPARLTPGASQPTCFAAAQNEGEGPRSSARPWIALETRIKVCVLLLPQKHVRLLVILHGHDDAGDVRPARL
jgi:hypothetical protein